ncbi:hypothetical protein G9A89_002504 [Geosiphon pyriformis]|nr:hypothetical protein G9A89_002504 [Geosiphon pyriformis]
MGKAYERAAIKNEWTNEDGSVFPISAANLFKFLKVRAETCTPRTLEGYVSAIAGYQRSYRQMDIDLGALRSDPQIQKLVNKNPKIYRNGSFKTGRKLKKNKKKMIDKVTVEYEYDDPMEMSMNENEYTKARGIVLNDPAVEATENLPILEGKDVGDMEEDPWDSGQDAEGEDEISPNDQSESAFLIKDGIAAGCNPVATRSFDPKSISGMNILHVVKSDQGDFILQLTNI